MYLTSKVIFNIKTDDLLFPGYGTDGQFVGHRQDIGYVKNMDEFREFITGLKNTAEFGINKATYMINIERNVIISDQDDRPQLKSMTFPDRKMSVILSTTGKLLHVTEIARMFQSKFPKFHIQHTKFMDPRPIYLESFDGHDVKYRPLTQNGLTNDIVIDVNGNELWPIRTGKPPVEMVQLLSKTTEKVH